MNCPNCGFPIKDGMLICENCGTELEIVSDVDIDIEMHETIKGIAKEQFSDSYDSEDEYYDDLEFDDDDNPSLIGMLVKSGSKIGKFFYVIVALLILAVLVIAIRMGFKISHENSLDYQVEMAQKAVEDNNLPQAIKYLEKAIKIDPSNAEYKFQIAEYYAELNKLDDAEFTLTEIAENTEFEEVKRVQAYKKLFSLYKDNGKYDKISDTLDRCDLQVVLNEYSSYIIAPPEFSADEGTYSDNLNLILSTSGSGTIYYTTDGTDPIDYGVAYSGPISLEYGSYTIKAVVINDYSISSEVVTKNYLIDVDFSFAPKVTPESGDFEHSFFIEVDVPVMYTCYYTVDGEEPNKESNKYVNPIPAQEGNHTYKFVVYANDGTPSEIVEMNYNVTLNTTISAADAVTALNQGLMDRGYLDETGCHRPGMEGKYIFMYSTIYPFEDIGEVYFVVEYIQDDYGNNKMTGTYYAINCYDGTLYSVDILGEDGFVLSPL